MILILKIHALTQKFLKVIRILKQNKLITETGRRQGHFSTLQCPGALLLYSVFFGFFFFPFLCRSDFKRKKKYFLRKISLLFVDGNSASNVMNCACDINLRGKKTRHLTVTRTFLLNLFWRPKQRFAFSRLYREIRSDQQTNNGTRSD